MNINKAIKKQGKSVNRFLLLMSFIFFILIFACLFTHSYQTFLLTYLTIIEIVILSAIFITINYYKLSYTLNGYKILIRQGIFGERINISGDKVILIGIEEREKDFQILLISSVKIRNKKAKKVDQEFLKNHGYISAYYLDIIKRGRGDSYYYIILNKGGLKKYPLLNVMYKACVYAEYSDEAINKIKEYREGIK
jgi:hypothetical protein